VHISDAALVSRSRNGDLTAFDQLVKKYEKQVFNLAYRMIGNYDDANDLAQEAFLRVYRSLPKFRGDAAFSTWLYRIVSNTCLDELRRRKQQRIESLDGPITSETGDYVRQIQANSDLPEVTVEKQELREFVQKAINQLPEDHRVVIILRDLQGLSYQEIADILNCSIGTVKSRLNRGRLKLRYELINIFPEYKDNFSGEEGA